MNKVILLGRVGRDPEGRTARGTTVANLSLATSRRWKDKNGEKQEETEWHNLVAFGKLAEIFLEWVRKGSQIIVEGSIKTAVWEKDGEKKYRTEIIVNQLELLGGSSEGKGERPKREEGRTKTTTRRRYEPEDEDDNRDDDEDIPF